MAEKKLRVGVAGVGFGSTVHIPGFQSEPDDFEVTAVWSRSEARVKEAAQKFSIPRAVTSYDDMLAMDDLDVISVVSPVAMHYEMTMAALDAGKHVICEKPFTLNQNMAKEMWQKATNKNLTHMVAHEFRFASARMRVKELIDEGYLGPLHIALLSLVNGPRDGFQPRPLGERDDASKGGGFLFSLGSHYIDCLLHWFGPVTSVSSVLQSHTDRSDPSTGALVKATADDTFQFVLQFASGGWGTMTGTNAAPFGPGGRIELYGKEGTLVTPHKGNGTNPPAHGTVLGGKPGQQQLEELPIPDRLQPFADDRDDRLMPFRLMIREFARGVREGTSPSPNFYDGYLCQQVLDAARESSATGKVVAIPRE